MKTFHHLNGIQTANAGIGMLLRCFVILLAVVAPIVVTAQHNYATPYTFTTLAGTAPEFGSVDGVGSSARFLNPVGVAVDSAGNVYIADAGNNTIRKINPDGTVATFAGSAGSSGSRDGTGTEARFNYPSGVAVDNYGNVYVTDSYNYTIRKITSAGVVTTLAGSAGNSGFSDGAGSDAHFYNSEGIAVDGAGYLYVADTGNCMIRKISPTGNVTTLAGAVGISSSDDGSGGAARFVQPVGVAVDSAGNVYVADDCTIRKITSDGVVTTLAGLSVNSGSNDGSGSTARFYFPHGVAVDNTDNLYCLDSLNHTIRRIANDGMVTTLVGLAGRIGASDGIGSSARLNYPQGMAVDSTGNFYVADSGSGTVRKITSGMVVTTLAGKVSSIGSIDGTGAAAGFLSPDGVAVDSAGNVYVTDSGNCTVRKITPGGVVTTLAGEAGSKGSTDGAGNVARFDYPYGAATDNGGNIYVTELNNNTIRKITPSGMVTTLAGFTGSTGSNDGTGSVARFDSPRGLAVDKVGNLYVADWGNSTIRKITSDGVVTTLAGTPGNFSSDDGAGGAAGFSNPYGVAVDGEGNVYVADLGNSTIRKITPAGVVTTLAGIAGVYGSVDGIGSAAQFWFPYGVAVDGTGNLYVTELFGGAIRKITPSGVVTTLAGSADGSTGATDGTGSVVRFSTPNGLAVDTAGVLYVADSGNSTIRRGLAIPALISASASNGAIQQSFTYAIVFSGAPTSCNVSGLPSGLSFDPINRVVSGAPTVLGVFSITLTATNSAGIGTATLTLTVAKGNQTITFDPITDKVYGDSPFTVTASASSGLAPIYSIVSGPAIISGDIITLTGAGTVIVRASQTGDSNYDAAVAIDRNFTVILPKVNQTITFASLSDKMFGDVPFALNATASSGLTPTYAIVSGPAKIIGNLVGLSGAGTVIVRASQAGDTSYNPAQDVVRSFVVGKAAATIGLSGLNWTYDGTAHNAASSMQSIVSYFAGGIPTGPNSPWILRPYSIAVDGSGNVYVADWNYFIVRKITPEGVTSTLAGAQGVSGSTDGAGSAARFHSLERLAADGAGNVYVGDYGTIRKITPAGIVSTIAGAAGVYGSTDGAGSAAKFNGVAGIAIDSSGNLFVCDNGNNTVRKITPGGAVTTFAGAPGVAGSADGTGNTAQFNNPHGIALDGLGNIYVGDSFNNSIRKITAARVVTTLAGSPGNEGSSDGIGNAASFSHFYDLTVDALGNVYVADTNNNAIRKITPGGLVSTLAGAAGHNGDINGTGSIARFTWPYGVAIDPSGNTIYVADTYNSVIRKITPVSPEFNITYNSSSIAPTAAGDYAVVVTLNDQNYWGSASGTLAIAKATLTVSADNKSKLQGTENPALTISYAGFVNGDDVSSLMAKPVPTTTASLSSPIGSYPIAPANGVSINYSFTYVNGLLNVVAQSIAPNDAVISIVVE